MIEVVIRIREFVFKWDFIHSYEVNFQKANKWLNEVQIFVFSEIKITNYFLILYGKSNDKFMNIPTTLLGDLS